MRTERMRDVLRRLRMIADGRSSRARAVELAERVIAKVARVERAGLLEHFNDAMRRAREPEFTFGDRVDERALDLMVERGMSPPDALLEAERELLDDELEQRNREADTDAA